MLAITRCSSPFSFDSIHSFHHHSLSSRQVSNYFKICRNVTAFNWLGMIFDLKGWDPTKKGAGQGCFYNEKDNGGSFLSKLGNLYSRLSLSLLPFFHQRTLDIFVTVHLCCLVGNLQLLSMCPSSIHCLALLTDQ